MSNVEKTLEMARRVGLSRQCAMAIYYIGLQCAARTVGQSHVDMVQIACAVKYASENKHLLKDKYRYGY